MSHPVKTEKPIISSSTAWWCGAIFIGLIIAAVNFIQAESNSEGHGGHGAATEQHDSHGAGHETSHGPAVQHEEEHGTQPAADMHDSGAAHEGHQETPAEPHAQEEAHH